MADGNDRPCAQRPATRCKSNKDIPSLDDAFQSVSHAITQVRRIILGLNGKEDKNQNRADRKQHPSSVERSAPQIGCERKPLQVKTYLPTDSSNSPTSFGDIRTQRNSPFIPTAEGSKYRAEDEESKRTYINNPDPRIDSSLQNPGRNETVNRPIRLSFPQRKFQNIHPQGKFSSIPVLQGINQNLNETFEHDNDNDVSSVDNPSPSESKLQHMQIIVNFPTCSTFCPDPRGGTQTQRNSSFIPTKEGSEYRADHEMSKRTCINNHDSRNGSSLQNPGGNETVNRPIRMSFPQEKVESTHPQGKSSSIPVVKGLNQNLNETFEHDNDNDVSPVDNPSPSESELQHAQIIANFPTCSTFCPDPRGGTQNKRNSSFIPTNEGSKYSAGHEMSKQTYINNHDPRNGSSLQNPGRNETVNCPIRVSLPQEKVENTHPQGKSSSIPVVKALNQNLNETYEHANDNDLLSSVDNPSPSESELQHMQIIANFPTCSTFCPNPCGGTQNQRNSSIVPTTEGSKYRTEDEMSKRTYINNPVTQIDSPLQNTGRNVEQPTVNTPMQSSFLSENYEKNQPQMTSSSIPVVWRLSLSQNETSAYSDYNDLFSSADNVSPTSGNDVENMQRITSSPTRPSPVESLDSQQERNFQGITVVLGFDYDTEDNMSVGKEINELPSLTDRLCPKSGNDLDQIQETTNLLSYPASSSSTEPQGNFLGIQLHYMIEEQPLLVDLNHLPSKRSESDRERVIADTNLQIFSDDNPSYTANNQPPDNSAATIIHDTIEDKNSAFEGFNHFPSPTNNSLPKSDSDPELLQVNANRPKCPSVCPNANLPKCPSVCPNANLPKCPSVCPNANLPKCPSVCPHANLPKCPSVCPNANPPKCPIVCPNVNPQHEGKTSGCPASALPRADPVQQAICPLAPCAAVEVNLPRCASWHDKCDGGVGGDEGVGGIGGVGVEDGGGACTRRRARTSRSIPSIEMSALDARLVFKKSFLCLGRKLLQAAERGRADHIRLLLRAGAHPNFTFGSQWTPLHRAARKGHAEVVALLLLRGADPMLKTASGLTALHVAAFNDYSGQCVTLLLDAGSDVTAANMSGRTALHYAAESGNMAAVRKLLAAGACKNARNAAGEAPLSVAKSECVRRLLR